MDPDDARHGTPNGYINQGCRCQSCRQAWAAYSKPKLDQYRARKRQRGECYDCKAPAVRGKRRCEKHLERIRRNGKRSRRARRRAA